MSRNQLVAGVFVFLGFVLVVLLYLNFFAPSEVSPAAVLRPAVGTEQGSAPNSGAPAPVAATAPTVNGRHTLQLYFQGTDVGLLYPEERVAPALGDSNADARQVIEELMRGPTKELLPTIPPGTRIREVYFDANGVAFVDFSAEIRDNHPGGSAEELLTIDSIVNSLNRNIPQVQAVRFLIEGRPVATLAGHVDLSMPQRPSTDRIAVVP